MNYEKTVTVAGKTIFVKVAHKKQSRIPGEKRKEKKKATPDQIEKVNQKNSERVLSIILNHNFRPGDYHLVLTHSGEAPSKEEAQRRLDRFKRQINALYKKHGQVVKWVTATEYENTRIHHHMVCNAGVELSELAKIWPHGFIRPTWLDDTGDYRRLAAYLIKETSKTFRDPNAVSRRRFNCSRSIEKPDSKVDGTVSAAHLIDPKPVPGYYIDPDSIYKGENPITGRPYIEYVMISLEDPRIKTWPRGKPQKLRHQYIKSDLFNQQLDMEEAYGQRETQ